MESIPSRWRPAPSLKPFISHLPAKCPFIHLPLEHLPFSYIFFFYISVLYMSFIDFVFIYLYIMHLLFIYLVSIHVLFMLISYKNVPFVHLPFHIFIFYLSLFYKKIYLCAVWAYQICDLYISVFYICPSSIYLLYICSLATQLDSLFRVNIFFRTMLNFCDLSSSVLEWVSSFLRDNRILKSPFYDVCLYLHLITCVIIINITNNDTDNDIYN